MTQFGKIVFRIMFVKLQDCFFIHSFRFIWLFKLIFYLLFLAKDGPCHLFLVILNHLRLLATLVKGHFHHIMEITQGGRVLVQY